MNERLPLQLESSLTTPGANSGAVLRLQQEAAQGFSSNLILRPSDQQGPKVGLPNITLTNPDLLPFKSGSPENRPQPAPPLPAVPQDNSPRPIIRDESVASKLARETLVIGGGIGEGMFNGFANLPDHLPEIGKSIAIGAALNAISKTGEMGAVAAFTVGAYFTTRYILNAIHDHDRWAKFSDAVSQAWDTDQYMWKNMHDVSNTAGSFAFDTSLSMASGYLGYKNKALADLLLSVLRVPIPVPKIGVSPAFMNASMWMDIMPPSYKDHELVPGLNDSMRRHSQLPGNNPQQLPKWSFEIHGSFQKNY